MSSQAEPTTNDDLAARVVILDDGPFAGWQSWTGNPFEEHAGPYFWRSDEGEGTKGVFVPEARPSVSRKITRASA